MKHFLPFFLSPFFLLPAHGQNLVPNPSFEEFFDCPSTNSNMVDCKDWANSGASNTTPDYFNVCGANGLGIPNIDFGFQYAHRGDGMSGVITYVWEQSPGWPDYREFIGVPLKEPLIIGETYFMSFHINHSGYLPDWQKIGANKIGMRFSINPFSETNPPSLDNFAHLYTDSVFVDTVSWYKVSGSFVADQGYEYVSIGNFFNAQSTDTVIFGGSPFGGSNAYYYIDDVCVSTDSLFNENWLTSIPNSLETHKILCYPNPVSSYLEIEANQRILSVSMVNFLGETVYIEPNLNKLNHNIDVSHLPAGTYHLELELSKIKQYRKILINP